MRTTIEIEDELLARAEAAASAQGRQLSDLVDEALQEMLEREPHVPQESGSPEAPYRIGVHGSGGACPGVDFRDNGSVLDAMEEDG